ADPSGATRVDRWHVGSRGEGGSPGAGVPLRGPRTRRDGSLRGAEAGMNVRELEAGIEQIVVPLGFSGSQNLLFCAATRNLIDHYPWVLSEGNPVNLERDCTDLMVTQRRGKITEVAVEGHELGDLLEEQVGPGA